MSHRFRYFGRFFTNFLIELAIRRPSNAGESRELKTCVLHALLVNYVTRPSTDFFLKKAANYCIHTTARKQLPPVSSPAQSAGPVNGGVPARSTDADDNKYARRSASEWFGRWLK